MNELIWNVYARKYFPGSFRFLLPGKGKNGKSTREHFNLNKFPFWLYIHIRVVVVEVDRTEDTVLERMENAIVLEGNAKYKCVRC